MFNCQAVDKVVYLKRLAEFKIFALGEAFLFGASEKNILASHGVDLRDFLETNLMGYAEDVRSCLGVEDLQETDEVKRKHLVKLWNILKRGDGLVRAIEQRQQMDQAVRQTTNTSFL